MSEWEWRGLARDTGILALRVETRQSTQRHDSVSKRKKKKMTRFERMMRLPGSATSGKWQGLVLTLGSRMYEYWALELRTEAGKLAGSGSGWRGGGGRPSTGGVGADGPLRRSPPCHPRPEAFWLTAQTHRFLASRRSLGMLPCRKYKKFRASRRRVVQGTASPYDQMDAGEGDGSPFPHAMRPCGPTVLKHPSPKGLKRVNMAPVLYSLGERWCWTVRCHTYACMTILGADEGGCPGGSTRALEPATKRAGTQLSGLRPSSLPLMVQHWATAQYRALHPTRSENGLDWMGAWRGVGGPCAFEAGRRG